MLGSLHCVGMCGPIALAVPVLGTSNISRVFSILVYNFSRITTYSLLGIIFGTLGKELHLAGFQQAVSITVGIILIGSILFPFLLKKQISKVTPSLFLVNVLKEKFRFFLKRKSFYSVVGIGLINGLLPCGLVYVALAGAINTGSPINGAFYMALFGMGTIPAMLALSSFKTFSLTFKNQKMIRKIIPVFVVAMGILFILRGLDLGIPYISPHLSQIGLHSHCH